MKENILKVLLSSALCASVALMPGLVMASMDIPAKTNSNTGSTAATAVAGTSQKKMTSNDYAVAQKQKENEVYELEQKARGFEEKANRANEEIPALSQKIEKTKKQRDLARAQGLNDLANDLNKEVQDYQKELKSYNTAAQDAAKARAAAQEAEKEANNFKKLKVETAVEEEGSAAYNRFQKEEEANAREAEKRAKQLNKEADELERQAEEYRAEREAEEERKRLIYEETGQDYEAYDPDEDEEYNKYLERAERKRIQAESEQKEADVAKAAAQLYKNRRSDQAINEGGVFSDLMWRFKDMDEEVARGDLSQSANLADKNRDAQKKLKEYDAEVKNKGLAQTKNLKQKDRDAQKKLKEYDAEVKNKGLAQTENLEQEDRKIQEYMKLLNTDETLPQGKKLAEKDRKIQDYMKVLDTEDKTLPQGGRLAEEDRKIQEYMKALNADQTLPQGQRLMQRDFDTQDALVYLDYEIKALAFARYHWWILDYGLAREYALRPLEFGYLSYHSALNDTMGGFSTAEDLYNLIFNGVSLGLNILGAVPNVVAGVEDVADMVDNYKKENLVNDIKNAQAGQANAKALSEELEQKATDETAAGEEAMKRAEEAKAEANRHNSEADRYDKEAQTYFEQEAAARERGRTDIAEDFRQKKEEAYYNAANERMLADQKSAEEGMALSEAQQHYQSAANYNDQKTAADQAYDSYVQQEQDASQSLKERIGLADTEEDIRQSQANVKQMQAEQDQISRERADASNQRAAYEAQADAYEQEAAGYRNAADMSYRVGDHATETNDTSAKMFYLEGDDARNMASKSETSAAEARMKANSEAEREQSLKNASAQYDTQIQAEKERQNAALKKQQQQQAEYAVLTGNATEEQKNIYKQSQQEKENSKTSKKVASWTDRMPSSAGEIVTGVEGAATRGIRTIFGQ